MRAIGAVALVGLVGASLSGCAVASVAGMAVSATTTVVGTAVDVTSDVVGGVADTVTGQGDKDKKDDDKKDN
ncbi:MAG TPA: hypothetical protein VGF56_14660 [Rhizomicrobium sp.]|jgi:hypothetical protein